MNKTLLKNYAKLIVEVGANIKKGQDVVINARVNEAYFAELVVEACYKAKARSVRMEWSDDQITRLAYKYQTVNTLTTIPEYTLAKLQHDVDTLPARIYIESDDPDALNSIDQDKFTKVKMKNGPVIMKYREQMENKYQWVIAGIPSEAWAKKVFPNETKANAIKKLWDAILVTTRVLGDPINNWKEHNKVLKEKCDWLNNLGIDTLYYKSANGTDFNVRLKEGMIFDGGAARTIDGTIYQPNMPTEECFTSPDKYSANGVVMATKPLSVDGKVVDNFGFRFENGKIVEVLAKDPSHKEVLEHLISVDEGARQLGEVALVPFDSPINQTGILFFNTLYDENACCHLAIGRAFEECIKDFDKKTPEEIKAFDLNKSIIHVDFMIGSRDLNITAKTRDGKMVQIFENGTWAK